MASSAHIAPPFILLAVVVCALLNAGNFGTIDTERRWQVARSIRLGEPMVTSDDLRQGFGIPGRNGCVTPGTEWGRACYCFRLMRW
jgi:hypothetical protein